MALSPEFYHKLVQVASDVGMKPEDLLAVMSYESGINPKAENKVGHASGLIQFMPETLRNVGFTGTHSDFRNLSAEEQLDYVHRYIKMETKNNGKPFESAAQYYVANFVPAALRLPGIQSGDPKTILAAENPDRPHLPGVSVDEEKNIYRINRGLDVDKDGAISYGDIQSVMNRSQQGKTYQNAVAQMESTTGYKVQAPTAPTNQGNQLENLLNQYLTALSHVEEPSVQKRAIKQLLPNDYLIRIQGSIADTVEFARILSAAIDEELHEDSTTHTNGHRTEMHTTIHGSAPLCTQSILQLSNALASFFPSDISVSIHPNKKSSYPKMTIEAALEYYDLFHRSANGK
jgi:Transglycosylase SLT domain